MSVKAIKKETVEDKKMSNAEAIEDLQKQVIHYNQMLLKAQGALEVLQMLEQSSDKE
tara:strand:+ start:29 stop:199 length:171 start_codon:yes stop_codon:yes gene_type:complete